MTYLIGSKRERKLLERKNREDLLRQQGASMDPAGAQRVVDIRRNWPMLRPGAVVGFAQMGLGPDAPEVKEAAKLAVKQNKNENDWKVHFKDYDQEAIDKQRSSDKPDPQYVLRSLLPRWTELQQKQSKVEGESNWTDKEFAEFQQLNAGLKYAALNYNDKQLSSIARQLDIKPENRKQLRALAGQARAEHKLSGAGDIAQLPYVGPVLENVVKPVVREAGVIANAPLQGLQGSLRNMAGGGNFLFSESGATAGQQTDLGTQYGNLLQGKTTNVGDGFLPSVDSPVAKQTAALERTVAPTIGGHAWTLGRGVANEFFEPDTLPFQVGSGVIDAGVAYYADPSSAVIHTLGDMRTDAKRFLPEVTQTANATGVWPTSSGGKYDQVTKGEWLTGSFADKTATKLREGRQNNPSAMFRAINDANTASPTFPIETIHGQRLIEELADAPDNESFFNAFAQATEVQQKFAAPGVSYHVKQSLDTRVLAAMPRGTVDISDKSRAWKTLDDVMRSAKVPVAERDAALNVMIRSDDQMAGLTAVSDTITNVLVHKYNIDPKDAKYASSFFQDSHLASRAYDIDQMTGHARVRPGVAISGEGHILDAPSLLTEGLNSPVQIPDTRTLRRMASDFNYITTTKPWHVSQTALRAPQAVWSPLQVLTIRQTVRDFGETQINMAGRGMINAFHDPIDWISTMIAANNHNKWGTFLEKIPGLHGRYLNSGEGQKLIAETDDLLMHSVLQFTDPDVIHTGGFRGVDIHDPEAAHGFAEELGRMNGDPIMKQMADTPDPHAMKEWFWNGEGKEHRLARAPMVKRVDDHNMQKVAAGRADDYIPIGDIANDRAAADRYLDEVLYPRLTDQTKGSFELLDAVRDGTLNGVPIYKQARSVAGEDLSIIHEDAVTRARELLDAGYGPQNSIKVREKVKKLSLEGGKDLSSKVLETTFYGLVDLPDRVLNRNPAWQQLQWKQKIQNAPWLSPEDLAKLKAEGRATRISREQMRQLDRVKTDVTEVQRLTKPQLEKLAKLNAVGEMADIVHDLKSRSQFFDMVKFLIPFGDAFRLVATRMVHLARDEPQVVRRAQQALQAAQQPESGTINRLLGDPVPDDQPLFHTDPRSGEEVVTFPGSSVMNQGVWSALNKIDEVTGLPIGPGGNPIPLPMVGRVGSFAMVSDVYPGFGGPVVTIGAKWLLPQGTIPEQMNDIIFPYGGEESAGLGGDIASLLPSYFRKAFEGPPDQKALASEVNNQLKVLGDSGDYDTSDPREAARMADDARENVIWLTRMRGVAQFMSPGAPNFEYDIHNKDGRLIATQLIPEMIRKHSKSKSGFDYDKGMKWFINHFGSENIFALQAGSDSRAYAVPVSREGREWADAHPEVKEKGALIYGYFTGEGKNAKNIDNWSALFDQGEREPLSAEAQIAQAQNKLGWYAWERMKTRLVKSNDGGSLTDRQEEWMREKFKPSLKDELPGWDTFLASPFDARGRRDSAIEQLQEVAKLPSVQGTDAGQGLAQYLAGRDKAIAAAKKRHLAGPFQAKSAESARDWLRAGAESIIEQHPDFAPIWDEIFSREMVKDVK